MIGGRWPGSTARVGNVATVMHADLVDDAVRTLRGVAPGGLRRVREAAVITAHADHLVVQVVREARAAGHSWSQIAAALARGTAEARSRRRVAHGRQDWMRELVQATRAAARWLNPGLDYDLDLDTGLELDADLELELAVTGVGHDLPRGQVVPGGGPGYDVFAARAHAGAR